MDTNALMVTAPAAVVAAVKALRDTFPKVDGLLVLAAAVVVGVALSWLLGTTGDPIREVVARGAFWGFAGSGFMAIADRISPPTPKV